MSVKLAPVISDAHHEEMLRHKPAYIKKHTYAGQLLMESIDRLREQRQAEEAKHAALTGETSG